MKQIDDVKRKQIICGVILAVILLSAFLVRFNGISFGLPLKTHPDEGKIVNRAIKILQHRDLNPRFFNYPSFYIYTQSALYAVIYGYGKLTGSFGDVFGPGVSTLYIAGRFLTLLLSIGTIFVVFILGKLFFGRVAGLTAAIFIAVSSLHVQNSIYITVDSPMTFLACLSVLMSALIIKKGPKLKYYILAGLFAGFAIGTKYTGFLVVLPLIYAHLYTREFKLKKSISKELVIGLLIVVLAFIVSTPYAILDFGKFSKDIRFESRHYSEGHVGSEAEGTSYFPYLSLLANGFGFIPLLLSLIGFVILLVRDKWKGIFLVLFPLVFFLFIGRYKVYFARNLVPLIPILSILAGVVAGAAYRWYHKSARSFAPWLKIAVMSVFALIVSYGAYLQASISIRKIRQITLPDTRVISSDWIERNLPEGSRIGLDHYSPRPDRRKYEITVTGIGGLGKNKKRLKRFDYVVTSSNDYGRYFRNPGASKKQVSIYNYIFKTFKLLKEFKADNLNSTGPTIRVYKVVK